MDRILIPTDFSDASVNSVAYGLQLASDLKLPVTLVHVIELYRYAAGTSESDIYTELSSNDQQQIFIKNAREGFDKLLNELKPKLSPIPKIDIQIKPGNLILELQNELEKADVLFIILSVTKKTKKGYLSTHEFSIFNKLNRPIILIPQNAQYKPIKKIMYAASINPSDPKVISFLAHQADTMGAQLQIAHILSEKDNFQQEIISRGFIDLIKETIPQGNISYFFKNNKDVIEGIGQLANDEQADVLVLLKKVKPLISSIINKSNTERLSYLLNIPVMYYHELNLK